MPIASAITAIIVTHNSAATLAQTVADLRDQTVSLRRIIIVDSGSKDTGYLDELVTGEQRPEVSLCKTGNIGFCAGNNRGIAEDRTAGGYLFVNPDCFLAPDWLEQALAVLAQKPQAGILSSPLYGYDLKASQPSGTWDSLGIRRTALGRWQDIGQGQPVAEHPLPSDIWEPQAICGALMLIPRTVIDALLVRDGQVFDERLFMYKDDIDLSLRVRRLGYHLHMLPQAMAWHCRGWNSQRASVPHWARLISARNEVRVAFRHRSAYLPLYALKYGYVRWLER
jgi:N-acetylglucosaminyl-diphospho-decaprenol L-rhamnosyltransferase